MKELYSRSSNRSYSGILVLLMTLGLAQVTYGQITNYFMTDGTITDCEGSFQDDNSGGAEGSPYSNSSYVFTICPDNPGDAIQLSFVAFALSTSPNPNNSDVLFIYDGDNTSANSMGSYTGTQLQGLDVTATINNATGCLTFAFYPNTGNAQNMPGWEALISCTTPCATPTAASVIQDPVPADPTIQTVGVCLDAPVTFADAGSFAEPGFTLEQYIWNFNDGSIDSTSGPVVTHSFDEPGEYIVSLTVQDNNGCGSLNLQPLQVLVSTIPEFNTEFDETVCLGGEAVLDGNPVQSITWTSLPPQVVAGETYLADGAGFSYSSALTFDFFDPGQVLEDCEDLLSVFVNMEHSYMGDLQIQISCPNGTTVTLVPFPNGGGSTFLGEAVDDGSTTPGVGYDYYWAPDANSGTWSDNAGGFGTSLPEGTYESEQDMCALVGCPLNGDWTFTVTDNLAIDNGYIFAWGLNFNPELYPGVTTFTPIIGLGPDSTYWQGPSIINTSADGNNITVSPDALGDYEYTFFATNNFGCTFDTTVVLTVVPGPSIDAGLDMVVCNDPIQMAPEVSVGGTPGDCVFTLVMEDTFGDGWNGHQFQVIADGNVVGTYTLNAGSFQEIEFTIPGGAVYEFILLPGAFNGEVELTLLDENGDEIYSAGPGGIPTNQVLFTESCSGFGAYVYEWTPPTGLSDPNIPDPIAQINQTTEYTVSVYPADQPGCISSDTVTIAIDPESDPGQDSTLVLCFNYGSFQLFDMLGGTPVAGGVWTNSNGDVVDGDFNTLTDGSDVFTYTVTNGGCVTSAQVDITVIPQGDPICCEFDFSYEITPVTCFDGADGQISFNIDFTTEGGPWTIDIFDATNTLVASQVSNDGLALFTDLPSGDYSYSLVDVGFCTTNEDFTIENAEFLVLEISPDVTICVDGTAELSVWSDQDPGNWIYTWDNGLPTGGTVYDSPVVTTTYSVFATTADGCISDPIEMTVNVRDSLFVQTIPDTLICGGGVAFLEVAFANGGFGDYEYEWTWNGVPIGQGDSISYSPIATSTFCVEITDECETPAVTECMLVEVEEPIDVQFTADTTRGCIPLELVFSHDIDPALYADIIWSTGDGEFHYTDSVIHEYDIPALYDITLTLTSPIGCVYSNTYDNYITVHPNPIAGFHAEPQPTMIPDTEIDFYDYSQGSIVSWYWTFDTVNVLGNSPMPNTVFEFPNDVPGTYPVQLTVTDINGCTDDAIRLVVVDDLFNLFVPNSFTPNNDGVNDIFFISGTDIDPDRFHLWIYNRWGELVFETEDILEAWTGNHMNGEYYVQNEVYNWRIVLYSEATADRKEYHGTVTVLR